MFFSLLLIRAFEQVTERRPCPQCGRKFTEEALTKLSSLYENYKQVDYALQIYQKLLQIEKISYNYYGLMKTYGIVGEIYMEKFQYDLALSAFKEGLILARSLNYDQEYFLMKIKTINQEIKK